MPQKSTRQARKAAHKSAHKTQKARKRRAASASDSASASASASPREEHHHYYSSMVFDGKNLTTESQKDDEPVQRRIYTMKQLEREIPIGAELLRNANIHTVPRGLQFPIPRELGFRTVLPNPADLGLLPPSASASASVTRSNRRNRHRSDRSDRSDLKLVVRDTDATRGRDLFQLPVVV
jgi:hypothetical protein